MSATVHRKLALLFVACLCVREVAGQARPLVRLSIPRDDHDPLYIDSQSIRWNGAIVHFKYVLDVPILGEAGGERRFRSNEVEGTIDCARRSFSVGTVTAHSGVAATGDATGGHTPKPGEGQTLVVDERKGSTGGYLFRYLCTRQSDGAKRSSP